MSDAGRERRSEPGEPEPVADPDPEHQPESMSRRSIAGLGASVALAVAGLFTLPPLRSLGLSFTEAFWTTITLEFVAVVDVVVSVLTLYRDRSHG